MVAQYMNPAPQTQLQNPQQPKAYEEMHKGWMDYFTHPTTRAMLMQFGLGMMMPQAPGQTFGGHFAQAVGDAGMAGARAQEQELATQQAETQRMQAERQAAASERAAAAEEGQLGIAGQRLELDAQGNEITKAKNIADADAEQRRLDIAQQQANQLGGYYSALAQTGQVKAAPPGYAEAIQEAVKDALFNADENATFGELFATNKAEIDKAFGVSAAPTPEAGASGATPQAAVAGATPWPGMDKATVGMQYKFPNGAVGEYISPGQVRIITPPAAGAAPLDSGALQ